jgi:hypothetical protein
LRSSPIAPSGPPCPGAPWFWIAVAPRPTATAWAWASYRASSSGRIRPL